MDRSRGQRTPQRTSALDWMSSLGRWLHWGGFALQLLWHLVLVADALGQTDDGMRDPDDDSFGAVTIAVLKQVVAYTPPQDTLIRGSIAAGILCIWWNPHFVQFCRGFTKHLLGFTQWYAFQGLTVFFRFVFRGILEMKGGEAQSRYAQLSAHLAMVIVMSLVSQSAPRTPAILTLVDLYLGG